MALALVSLLGTESFASRNFEPAPFRPSILDASTLEVLARDPDFSTLQTALDLTGLTDVLREIPIYTVAAPTNEAFAALGNLSELLDNPDLLREVLLNHVVTDIAFSRNRYRFRPGFFNSRQFTNAAGELTQFSQYIGFAFVNNEAKIVDTQRTRQGFVLKIDDVLDVPRNQNTILEELSLDGRFNIFLSAVRAANLERVLQDLRRPFTVFVPTDEAFLLLGEDVIQALLADTIALQQILLVHVVGVPEVITASEVAVLPSYRASVKSPLPGRPLENLEVPIEVIGESIFVGANRAQVIDANNQTFNGLYHAIDRVISADLH